MHLDQVDTGIRRLIGEESGPTGPLRRISSVRLGPDGTHRDARTKFQYNVRVVVGKESALEPTELNEMRTREAHETADLLNVRKTIKGASKQELEKRRLLQRKLEAKQAAAEASSA